MSEGRSMWIFGYGSLIWRPDFPYEERRAAYIRGYMRRFWQGSTDHRGVPEAPGRVVTLIESPSERVGGVGYRVAAEVAESVIARLDVRESGGYTQWREVLWWRGERVARDALVYVAAPGNGNFLGEASIEAIARQVAGSVGPSGRNSDYVLELERALGDLAIDDPHVRAVAEALRALGIDTDSE